MTICGSCGTEMKCTENGISVAHKDNPKWIRTGDEFTCPNCGTHIIQNFGEPFHSETEKVDVLFE